MAHPQHPSCPDCKKALFKSAYKAKVKPSDPYAFCRNKVCPSYTFRAALGEVGKVPTEDQITGALPIGSLTEGKKHARGRSKTEGTAAILDKAVEAARGPVTPAPSAKPTAPEKPAKPVSKRGAKRAAVPSSEAPPKRAPEPEPIAKARERLRVLIKDVSGGMDRHAIGIVLAIISQETGNQAAADALIEEYKLDESLGFQKFSDLRP